MYNREKSNLSKILAVILLCLFIQTFAPAYAIRDKKDNSVTLSETKNETLVTGITFDEVLKKAKEHSYDLQIADYNVLISKQDVRMYKSEYFPKLNLGAGMEYTKNYRDLRDTTVMSIGEAFINPYTRFQSILGITVGYNLFDFGVRGGHVKMAKEDVELKELQTKQTLQDLNLTLLDSYSKILITTKQLELNKEILTLQEKNLEMKNRLYKAKEISKTELNDAGATVSKTKARIADLKAIRQEALNWLSFYTGENYDSENLKVSDFDKTNFDPLSSNDYTKSIVWKIHEKNIKKKELELYVAKRNNYPKINAYGRYYLYGSDYSNWGKSMGVEPSNFSVGASVNMPIFDGFKNSANIQKTSLELQQLYVERDKAIAQLGAKLATMRSNLIFLDEQISENNLALGELITKEKSVHKLVSKRLVSPIEENEAKSELLTQEIELSKNSITKRAITQGIQILTEEYKD